VRHTTRTHLKPRKRMSGYTPPLTSTLEFSKNYFTLDSTMKYGQSHYTAWFWSKPTCQMNSSMVVKLRYQANFISFLVTSLFY
jgi:hypothetical protein